MLSQPLGIPGGAAQPYEIQHIKQGLNGGIFNKEKQMMKNLQFQRSRLGAALAVSAIIATLGFTNTGVAEPARRLVIAQAADKVSGEGVIKGVNSSERKLQMAHGPIPELKWPGMTMEFGVASNVDLSGLAPGLKVRFTLSRDTKGLWVIDEIKRVE